MQKYTLLLLALFPFCLLNSQPVYKGIVLMDFDRYQPGDTVDVYASKSTSSDHLLFLVESAYGDKYVGSEKVALVDDGMDYWEKLWFENRAACIHNNGWDMEQRNLLMHDFSSYMAEMEEKKLILQDEFIVDYFRQLVLMIHPGELKRPEEKQIDVVILTSPVPEIFAFNCGTIVITTGNITLMENEEQLVKLLSRYIAHLVMEDNLINLEDEIEAHRAAGIFTACATIASAVAMGVSNIRNETEFGPEDVWLVNRASSFISHALVSSVGAGYSENQISGAKYHAAVLMSDLQDRNIQFRKGKAYTIRIAPVLKNLAWQLYYQEDYDRSRETIDRLFKIRIEDEEDYLLLAKLYRATAENKEELRLALYAINKAEDLDDFNFVEVLFEKGMILMRLDRYTEAKAAFEEYLAVTEEVGGDPDEIGEAQRMVIRCNQLVDVR